MKQSKLKAVQLLRLGVIVLRTATPGCFVVKLSGAKQSSCHLSSFLFVMQGIYLTLERQADGRHKLLRIRFNRNVYSKKEAEVWWNSSKHALAKAHNLAPGSFLPHNMC